MIIPSWLCETYCDGIVIAEFPVYIDVHQQNVTVEVVEEDIGIVVEYTPYKVTSSKDRGCYVEVEVSCLQ